MKDAPPNTKLTSTSVLQLRGNILKFSYGKIIFTKWYEYHLETHAIKLSRDENWIKIQQGEQ